MEEAPVTSEAAQINGTLTSAAPAAPVVSLQGPQATAASPTIAPTDATMAAENTRPEEALTGQPGSTCL